jgi:acid stress chaperone HdeB
MRNITPIPLACALVLATSFGGHAQVMLDLSRLTCDQFIKYKVADPKLIAVWLAGYFHGKRGDTTLDTQRLVADADQIEKYCFANADALLMQSVEKLIGPRN